MCPAQKLTGYPSIDKPWMKFYDQAKLDYNVPKMNIYDYLRVKTAGYEKNVAMTFFGMELTYDQFFTHIDTAAKALYAWGVRKGTRILYLMPNIPESAFLFYGGAKLGAVSDFIDPRPDSINPVISAQKTLLLIEEERPQYIIALDQCYLAMLKPIASKLPSVGVHEILLVSADNSMDGRAKLNYLLDHLYLGGISAVPSAAQRAKKIKKLIQAAFNDSPVTLLKYDHFIKNGQTVALPDTVYQENMLVAIVHSSGTSSPKPKPIPLTHDNMNFYAHQTFAANMPMKPGDRGLHMLPFFAAYGLVGVLHSGLCHANNLISIPEFRPADMGKLILKHRPQTIIGVPSWYLAVLEEKKLANSDLSFLTMITYGGDSMNPADEERVNAFLKRHGCPVPLTKGHGMSETSGGASFAIGEYNKLGSIGIPMPYTTYGVVDVESKELLKFSEKQDYIEGELIISSKAVTGGRLDGKEIVPHTTYHGEDFIFTRDIVRMDKDGIMTFLARSNRSFTRYDGYKIRPYLIEEIIKSCPAVRECVVSQYEDKKKRGLMPLATILLKEDVILATHQEQVSFVKQLVQDYFVNNPEIISWQIPSRYRFTETLPYTSNGKLDYAAFAREELCGAEVCAELDETAISIGKIAIF